MTGSYPDIIDTVARLIADAMLEREAEWEGPVSPDRRLFQFLMAGMRGRVERGKR